MAEQERFAGQVLGFAGMPRDWSMSDDWHRGYLRGRLAGHRFRRSVATLAPAFHLLANALVSFGSAIAQCFNKSEEAGEEQELTAEQLRKLIATPGEARCIRFNGDC